MRERGIIFSTELIPKVLDGTKTMTRRTYGLEKINKNPDMWEYQGLNKFGQHLFYPTGDYPDEFDGLVKCPYGAVGDRLWVKETFWRDQGGGLWGYRADGIEWPPLNCGGKAVPPRFMPRWASRKDLEITELGAERLQSIGQTDIKKEGIEMATMQPNELWTTHIMENQGRFANLWDSLNPRYPWAGNFWVWPISFKLL